MIYTVHVYFQGLSASNQDDLDVIQFTISCVGTTQVITASETYYTFDTAVQHTTFSFTISCNHK